MGAVDEAQVRMLAWIMQTLVRIQCPKGGSLFIYFVLLLCFVVVVVVVQRHTPPKELSRERTT